MSASHRILVATYSCRKWFTQAMRTYDQAGYHIEVLFVYAAEETMICRANKRAKETGRYTDPEHVRLPTEVLFKCQLKTLL